MPRFSIRPCYQTRHAKDYGYDPQIIRFDPGEVSQRTNEKGEFHTVVIPGRGILSVQCTQLSEYCVGLGSDKMEVKADGRLPTYNFTSPKYYNCVAEIDVPANTEGINHDFTR